MSDQSTPIHLVRGAQPDSPDADLLRVRAEIEARDRQETAIAELGQAALTGVDPLILLGQACALMEMTLQVSHCRALEIVPGGRMIVRGAVRRNESCMRCTLDADEDESLGMFRRLSESPFTFGRREEETRFKATRPRSYHGVRSGAGVVIRTQHGPFGVMPVY